MWSWQKAQIIVAPLLALPGCQTTGQGVDSGGKGMYVTDARDILPSEADFKLDGLKDYGIQKVTSRTRDNAHIIQTITLAKGQGIVSEERLIGPNYYANETSFPANDSDLFKKKLEQLGYTQIGPPSRFTHRRGFGQGYYASARAKNGIGCFVAFGGYVFGNDLRGLHPNNYQTVVTVNYCAHSPDPAALINWLSSLELRS